MRKLISWIFGLPICKHCNSLNIQAGYYIRGWNNMCNQACGDNGYFCMKCCKITFVKSLSDYQKTLPEWCEANVLTTKSIN